MSEMPPPERRPEPLGFDPAKNRVADASRGVRDKSGDVGSIPETRNLQRDLIGQTIGGRYQVHGILGEGGMGTVYEAVHLGLGRPVAIKILNPSQAKKKVAVKRFQQEARAAGAIGHPNICEVYDMGLLDDASPFLVMEKLVGQTLAERIQREGGLPFDELSEIMIQVLSGLIAAHEKGIVHRDIKPENIFLARRVGAPPIVKILDFGVSKMIAHFPGGEESLDLTRTGMVMGTPYYMSPEQARGERNLDGRVDVYACGVMMYEALVGKRPFLAPNYNALLLAIINTVPRSIREIRPATPPAMEAVVARAMAKARDDRYPTALHLLRDIQTLGLSRSGSAPGARVPPPPTPEERARAAHVGGRRVDEQASAMLRARMADPRPPVEDTPSEQATRLDVRAKRPDSPPPPPGKPARPDSDSIEIPIHITGSDIEAVFPAPPPQAEYVDEAPTEVFRPGAHPSPSARPRPAPAAPPPPPPPPPSARTQPKPQQQLEQPTTTPEPFPPRPVFQEDWEGETIVRRPGWVPPRTRKETVDPTQKLERPSKRPSGAPGGLNFDDETRIAPPSKRPQR